MGGDGRYIKWYKIDLFASTVSSAGLIPPLSTGSA